MMNTSASIVIDEDDIRPVKNVVKLVTGKDYSEMNNQEIQSALNFYYSCVNLMRLGKLGCFIAPR